MTTEKPDLAMLHSTAAPGPVVIGYGHDQPTQIGQ
jgi:hypothetical protein